MPPHSHSSSAHSSSAHCPSAEDLYYGALDRLAEGDAPRAASALRRCLTLDPGMLDAMHALIRALQDSGELDKAIAVANRLAQLDPDEVLVHTSLSILYQHKGMIPEAEAEAAKAKILGWKRQLQQQKSQL